MKKILIMFVIASILFLGSVKAATNTNVASLKVYFVNQDPYPAEPGNYVTLLFKLENTGTKDANNVTVELQSIYPFSLDPGVSTINDLGTVKAIGDEMPYQVKYKLKVDNDALNGENEVKLKYVYDNEIKTIKTFNVTISNPKTDFGIVTQDSTGSSTTFAIANIGANDAYSVIVSVPQQVGFRATGTSSSVVGNLNAGDYTLVSFQIASAGNATRIPTNFTGGRENVPNPGNFSVPGNKNLIIEVSYTDSLGIRRTVDKEIGMNLNNTLTNGIAAGGFRTSQGSQFQTNNGMIYIIVGVVGIVGIFLFFKFRKKIKRK